MIGLVEECEEEKTCVEDEEIESEGRRALEEEVSDDANDPEFLKKKKNSSGDLLRNLGIMFVIAIFILIFLLIFRLLKFIALSDYKYYRVYMTI